MADNDEPEIEVQPRDPLGTYAQAVQREIRGLSKYTHDAIHEFRNTLQTLSNRILIIETQRAIELQNLNVKSGAWWQFTIGAIVAVLGAFFIAWAEKLMGVK